MLYNDTTWNRLNRVFNIFNPKVYRYLLAMNAFLLAWVVYCISIAKIAVGEWIFAFVLVNLLITPIYTGFPRAQVAGMIPTLLLPFNLVKGTINAALVLILYKPIRRALHAARLLPHAYTTEEEVGKGKRAWVSILVSIVGILVLAGALAAFLWVLHGNSVFW